MIEETLCPTCNGPMISRKGPYGTFWGCKKYPDCKGTRDSMGRSKADRDAEKAANNDSEESQSVAERSSQNDKYRFRKS